MFRAMESLFDSKIRPALASHGGNAEIIDIENDKVFIKMTGGCQGCASSAATLKDGIERLIKENFEDITEVIDLTAHDEGENPYFK